MGVVYLAEPLGGGEPCALKLIRPEHADDADFRARFDREVTLAHRVTGLFTARVLGAETTGEAPWLATECVHGPELGQVVRDQGPLTEDLLRSLAAGLVEALQAIHGVGLVPRDLKPSNVLVTEYGPRVIDFGIARVVDGTAFTVTGQGLDTPGYMAPELVRGGEPAPEADVFALAGVLSYAATGHQPFGTGEAIAVLFRAVTDEPDLDGVPITLCSLVARCLAKEPSVRPSLTELHTAFVGRGGEAREEIPKRGWLSGAVTTDCSDAEPDPQSPARFSVGLDGIPYLLGAEPGGVAPWLPRHGATPDEWLGHGADGLVTVMTEDGEVLHELEVPLEGEVQELWLGSLEPSWTDAADIRQSDLALSAAIGQPDSVGVFTWDLSSGELV